MLGMLQGWSERLRGLSNINYESLASTQIVQQVPQMPGAFDVSPNSGSPSHDSSTQTGTSETPINSSGSSKVAWIFENFLLRPTQFILFACFHLFATIVNAIHFRTSHNILCGSNSSLYVDGRYRYNPINLAHRFVCELEDAILPRQLEEGYTLPPFFHGSFSQALLMATSRAKFLFVYLTTSHNEESHRFLHLVIINHQFCSLFSSFDDVIIWGGDVCNSEAYQLANSLNVTKLPFLGLLCLTRPTTVDLHGTLQALPEMSLILKIVGEISQDSTPEWYIDHKFMRKIARHRPDLIIIRNELKEIYLRQQLVMEQEHQYQVSNARDREKARRREQENLMKKYLVYRAKEFRALELAEPPMPTSKIAFKLFDGSRKTLVFPADSHVNDLYVYVELVTRGILQDNMLEANMTIDEARAYFTDYEPQFSFSLVSPLPPRKTLDDLRQLCICDVECIYPNGLVIAEKITE